VTTVSGRAITSLFRTWAPTALGSSMLAWEIPLVSALVARMQQGAEGLAALGIALSILFVLNSPALALTPLVVSEGDPRARHPLFRHAMVTGVVGCALIMVIPMLLSLTALGSDDVRDAVRGCLLSLGTVPLAVALRRYLHGCLIQEGRTQPIALATVVRICCTIAAGLMLWQTSLAGATAGGLTLMCGAWGETALLAMMRTRTPVDRQARWSRRVLVKHAQLSSSILLNMSPRLITTIGIVGASDELPSLIVWPAMFSLMALGTVPLTDLDSVGASFLKRGGDRRNLRRFCLSLSAVVGAFFVAIAVTPLGRLYLVDFTHVPPAPANLGIDWLWLLACAPALWAVRGYLRALAIAGDASRLLPWAAGIHLLALTVFSLVFPMSGLPGVACASMAVFGALCIEIFFLILKTLYRLQSADIRSEQ